MSLLKFLARSMIAAPIIVEGVNAIKRPEAYEKVAEPLTTCLAKHTPLTIEPRQCVRASGGKLVAVGVAASLGILPRLAGATAAVILVPLAFLGHPFWKATEHRDLERAEFLRHLGLAGAALILATTPRRRRVEHSA